ncbi:MAG: hypothetical protein HOH74_06670, partial [Gemmatimonadetes bacterium]|nr:hypothetical protein [Gemmatimonadota bacterium]
MNSYRRNALLPVAAFVLILCLLSMGCSSASSPMASTSTPLAIGSDELTGNEQVLPAFVVDAVVAAMPDARLVAATLEEEDDEVVYEVLVENDEGIFEVDVSVDGVVIEIEAAGDDERPISVSDLPAAVLSAVEDTVPGGRITEAVRESIRGQVIYDVEVDVRGEKFDLEIAADGT